MFDTKLVVDQRDLLQWRSKFKDKNESNMTHNKPAIEQKNVQHTLLNKLVDAAFSGSASQLVMQALGQGKTSKAELEEIKKLIEQLEGEQK